MTDLLAERFAALTDPLDDSDWLDVRRRAGHDRSRPWVAVTLAAALVALVVGSAFAYYADVVDFGSAEKADSKTVLEFDSLSVGAPSGMDPEVIADEARRVEVATASGPLVLFVAPTKAGGFCHTWDELVGGCDKLGTNPLSFSEGGTRDPGSSTTTYWITANVDARYISSVELHFVDGAVVEPPITWVSSPIDRGFLFHELPRERSELTSIVALDDDGNVVTVSQMGRVVRDVPPAEAILDQKTEAASISTRSGKAVIWEAPNRYEGTCAWLELEGQAVSLGCQPKGEEYASPTLRATPETVVLSGRALARYRELELRFADGSVQHVLPDNGYFLLEIPQQHLEPATRLVDAIPRDARGRALLAPQGLLFLSPRKAFDPCFRVLPLPRDRPCA